MRSFFYLFFTISTIVFMGCKKENDQMLAPKQDQGQEQKEEKGNATVTIGNRTHDFTNVTWYYNSEKSCYFIHEDPIIHNGSRLSFYLQDNRPGTYTLSNSITSSSKLYNIIDMFFGQYNYQSRSGSITITSSNSKQIKGTFTGDFLYSDVTAMNPIILKLACSFNAYYKDQKQ